MMSFGIMKHSFEAFLGDKFCDKKDKNPKNPTKAFGFFQPFIWSFVLSASDVTYPIEKIIDPY